MAHHFSPTSPNFTLFATKNDFLFSRACCSFLSASRPRKSFLSSLSPSLSSHPFFPSFPPSLYLSHQPRHCASRLTEHPKKTQQLILPPFPPATASLTPDTPSLVIFVWRTREPPAEPQPAPLTTTAILSSHPPFSCHHVPTVRSRLLKRRPPAFHNGLSNTSGRCHSRQGMWFFYTLILFYPFFAPCILH